MHMNMCSSIDGTSYDLKSLAPGKCEYQMDRAKSGSKARPAYVLGFVATINQASSVPLLRYFANQRNIHSTRPSGCFATHGICANCCIAHLFMKNYSNIEHTERIHALPHASCWGMYPPTWTPPAPKRRQWSYIPAAGRWALPPHHHG